MCLIKRLSACFSFFLSPETQWNMFAWTEERKEGRKEGRQINLSGYVKQTVLSNIRQSSVYTLYITTIPKDPCSFLLFNKRILCVWLSESLFLLWWLAVPLFLTYWPEGTASAFSSSVTDFTKGVILQGPVLWGWVSWFFHFSVSISCLSTPLYIFSELIC